MTSKGGTYKDAAFTCGLLRDNLSPKEKAKTGPFSYQRVAGLHI